MASQESLTSMAKTALGMARVRAEESRRPDRLFDDPYAEVFLAAAHGRAVPGSSSGGFVTAVRAPRTDLIVVGLKPERSDDSDQPPARGDTGLPVDEHVNRTIG